MSRIPDGLLDTIRKNNAITNPPGQKVNKSLGDRVFDYLAKGNVKASLGLIKFPLNVNSQAYTVSESVNYGLGFSTDYRLYKNLFTGFQAYTNLWNNKHISLSSIALTLSNDLIFNKRSRSITLTPYAGFEYAAVSYQKEKVDYNTFSGGLRLSYELTHKKALFISSGFNTAQSVTTLKELMITPSHYTIGLGIVLKN